jgi:hypothetical protein
MSAVSRNGSCRWNATFHECSVPSRRSCEITSKVELSSEPLTGMIPSEGMSSSTGAGKPVAIEPERWNPLAAEPA